MNPSKPATVLIVEDQDRIRVLLAEFLSHEGFHVLECPGGESATAALLSTPEIAAVILDWLLSGTPALDVLRQIMGHPSRPGCVIISGYRLDNSILPELAEDRVTFLEKPFTAEMIREALSRLGVTT